MTTFLPNYVAELVEQLQLIPHPEGGFFRETYRSGSVPMASRGLTDTTTASFASRSLVQAAVSKQAATADSIKSAEDVGGITNNEPVSRNAITSIYWVPTIKLPKLMLAKNLSDHIHYYQGGGYAFLYYIYSPTTRSIRRELLGPNLLNGQRLQVPVVGGEWKCGHLVSLDSTVEKDDDTTFSPLPLPLVSSHDLLTPDYVIIGEGVGPGFCIHDFNWITDADLNSHVTNITLEQKSFLQQFLHADMTVPTNKEQDFDEHYDTNDATEQRIKERA